MKKKRILFLMFILLFPVNIIKAESKIDDILLNMDNKQKIAQMLMPSFSFTELNNDYESLFNEYGFAGVILNGSNIKNIEQTVRLTNSMQSANVNHPSLFIATDQEGGYVTRLNPGTVMPGNMALAATNDKQNAYLAGKIMGKELSALGINVDFAPVVDVNNNPNNPVIGVRSFSDDTNMVSLYAEELMKGLQSEGISTSLKHFPGHGDTDTDTHSKRAAVFKTYDEIKQNELIPFQKLIDGGTNMIMTAHIEYPYIETNKYIGTDNEEYNLPATLSKKILTDILRGDMGYDGVIVTDAMNMGSITNTINNIDAATMAINAGADIILMPYAVNNTSQIDGFKAFISNLANKVGNEISQENVDNSVRRILKLKEEKGLLNTYDSSNLERKINNAKNIVSSNENHDLEFDIAKKAITMIKNDDKVLPLNTDDKIVVLYEYASHIEAVNGAIRLLKKDGIDINENNISVHSIYDSTGNLTSEKYEEVKEIVKTAKNVIMIHSLYTSSGLYDPDLDKMNNIIDYIHENGGNVVVMSTQLPYDVVKFKKADALVITYLANGIKFNLEDYDSEIPAYGANVMAGIYMLFSTKENMNGTLPINIYDIDNDSNYTNEILYNRGFGLKYHSDYVILDGDNQAIYVENVNDLVVRTNGDIDNFVKLLVDNKEMDKNNYSIKVGSTIVTINHDYLTTLSVGNHSLTIVYNDGEVSTNFSIKEKMNEENPPTIDNIYKYMILFVLSLGIILINIKYLKRI